MGIQLERYRDTQTISRLQSLRYFSSMEGLDVKSRVHPAPLTHPTWITWSLLDTRIHSLWEKRLRISVTYVLPETEDLDAGSYCGKMMI